MAKWTQKFKNLINPLTTGEDHFWSSSFLTLREIEIAVIFRKYEK